MSKVGYPNVIDKLEDFQDELRKKPYRDIDAEYLIDRFIDLVEIIKDEFKKTKEKDGSTTC